MKTLLFTLPNDELEEVLARYSARAPEPLNRQFPERVSKAEAVKGFETRKKKKKTILFPPGQLFVAFHDATFSQLAQSNVR